MSAGNTGITTKYTAQEVQNLSFDNLFYVSAREILGYDATNARILPVLCDTSGQLIVSMGTATAVTTGPYLSLPFTLLQP